MLVITKQNSTNLNPNAEPDPAAPFEVKKTQAYGLQIANLISREWFNGTFISKGCLYQDRQQYVIENRLFERGKNDINYFKNYLKRGDNDLNYLNLDWSMLNLTKKFCNNVANGIRDEYYRLDITPMDPISTKLRADKERAYRRDMLAMPLYKKAKETLGIDLQPKGFVPEDDEELQFRMELDEKSSTVIGEEILIEYIKKTNGWENFQQQKNKDLVLCSIAGARVYTDKNDGIKIQYVDVQNYIHSYVKRNDFSDKYYDGYVDTISLADLKRESGFSDTIIRQIAKLYAGTGRFNVYDVFSCDIGDLLGFRVDVLRFAYKTWKTETYKKSTRKDGKVYKVSKKGDDYDSKMKISRTLDTWFEGNVVIGSPYIYDYKECENIARDKMNKAMSPFVMRAVDIYENNLTSFLDDIKNLGVQMQIVQLQLQKLCAELRPDQLVVNWDALADITGTGDKQKNWKEMVSLLNTKGIIFESTIDMGDEGGVQRVQAARTQSSGQGSAIPILMNRFAELYNMVRDISGVNPATDGSMPADALVGVAQLQQLATNTNTKHIVDASVDLDLRISECISTRIGEIFRSKDASHIKDLYLNVVGQHGLELRESLGDRHLNEFGFVYEMLPTTQRMQELKEALSIALQTGDITVGDKLRTEDIAHTNLKLANRFLDFRIRKNRQKKQEENERNIMLQSQANQQSAQAAAAAEGQVYQANKMVDLSFEAQMAKIRVGEYNAKKQIDAPYQEKEFQQDAYLKQIDGYVSLQKQNQAEDRKDERLAKQSTYNSQMITQRQKDTGPVDFEEEELWDIDMEGTM